jgi:anion transporter
MPDTSQIPKTPAQALEAEPPKSLFQKYGLLIAFIVLIIVLALPTPKGLSVAGQRTIGILLFAVITWISEAVTYPVSATIIASLLMLLLGSAPALDKPGTTMGYGKAISMTFAGISSSGAILVGAALFLAAAMMSTGLDKRIALGILSKVGSKTNRIVAGMIFIGFVLAFFVPSTTARVGCIVPIVLGIIAAFGMKNNSRFAALLMIATVHAASIWNIGIKTAAAQNMVAIGFINKELGADITWLHWFITAAPYAAIMSIILYFLCMKMLPPETKEVAGGDEAVKKSMAELGPMKATEKKLVVISVVLLLFWVTEGILHKVPTTLSTCVAVTLMFLPGINIMTWKQAQAKMSWGTLLLFGVGISLGTALLSTKAAAWMANQMVTGMGLAGMSVFAVFAIMALFLIVVHLGFASATAVASSMIPIMIAVLKSLNIQGLNIVDITMLLQFVVSFGFILPVNSPQGILAFATDTFTAKDCIKVGLPLTIIGYVLLLIFANTYWKFMGIL